MSDLDYVVIDKAAPEPSRTWTRSELEILIRSIVADELSKLDPECDGAKRAVDKLVDKLNGWPVDG